MEFVIQSNQCVTTDPYFYLGLIGRLVLVFFRILTSRTYLMFFSQITEQKRECRNIAMLKIPSFKAQAKVREPELIYLLTRVGINVFFLSMAISLLLIHCLSV